MEFGRFLAIIVSVSIGLRGAEIQVPEPGPLVEELVVPKSKTERDPFADPAEEKAKLEDNGINIRQFRVSKVGKKEKSWENRETLLLIFDRLNTVLEEKHRKTKGEGTFEVKQNVGEGKYLAISFQGCRSENGEVLPGDLVLVEGASDQHVDGDYISLVPTVSEENYEYVSTNGAKRRVRRVRAGEAKPFIPLKQEEFVALLKNKTPVAVAIKGEADCRKCFGDGLLSALEDYKACPSCGGKGTKEVINYYVVSW